MQVSIKGERLRLKLTQSQLAEKIGISRRMMSYIETGERGVPPEAAEKMAQAFGWSIETMWSVLYRKNCTDSSIPCS